MGDGSNERGFGWCCSFCGEWQLGRGRVGRDRNKFEDGKVEVKFKLVWSTTQTCACLQIASVRPAERTLCELARVNVHVHNPKVNLKNQISSTERRIAVGYLRSVLFGSCSPSLFPTIEPQSIMAPDGLTDVQEEMESTVHNLYSLMSQMYSHGGDITEAASKREVKNLIGHLLTLSRTAPTLAVEIPQDIIQYVQEGRNPEIYTREFVEFTMKNNQLLKGKQAAFAAFRDVLAKEIAGAVPELKGDVKRVVEKTGGMVDG